MYEARDEAAREKIRMLVQQGKDPESLGNYYRDIRDYQDRYNERNRRDERNSSFKIFSITYNQPSENTNNKTLTEIVLTAEQSIAQHNHNLDELNRILELIVKCLKTDSNPGWFITQMFDLKNKCEARMKSLKAEEESMKYLARRNAEESTRKLAWEKAQRKRQKRSQ